MSAAKTKVSSSGGSRPRWKRDGQELYYVGRDSVVAVSMRGGLPAGVPSKLFSFSHWDPIDYPFDVDAAGRRFVGGVKPKTEPPLVFIFNWRGLLRK